jgi:hypothetical protein
MTTPEPGTDRTFAGRVLPDNSGMAAGLTASATAEPGPPIVCDMTDAPDTGPERLAEYARLFDTAYLGRDRDQASARWLLRAGPGVEEWARDLADRENACCAFMTNTVTREGDLVIWQVTTIDDEAAKAVLDVFHDLPLHRWSTESEVQDTFDRWSTTGVPIIVREAGVMRPATAAEIREGRR